ncbi:MAG: ADP-ribosylglycohydrolase family protein, partial [Pseudomonadota bacterium]|nr:ADP-ribosylglycohydrolase family protein [Pseudomonadota bacterium]
TLRAILKLWLGEHSGVFSAGNGPAMRSPLIGVCYGAEPQKLLALVRASTRLTHTDPKAEFGALAIAVAAYMASSHTQVTPSAYYLKVQEYVQDDAFLQLLNRVCNSVDRGESSAQFAAQALGLDQGISGYMYHTVPVVIHGWLSYQQDYQTAIKQMIRLGGDTDTTAAILGAILGAQVGKPGIPQPWLTHLAEWPRTVTWMEQLAQRLAAGTPQTALPVSVMGLMARNGIFMGIILLHGLRRLLPPY